MGAGSKIATENERKEFLNQGKTSKHFECKFHWPILNSKLGTMHFLNTGKPYVIEQCMTCKREYVKEL